MIQKVETWKLTQAQVLPNGTKKNNYRKIKHLLSIVDEKMLDQYLNTKKTEIIRSIVLKHEYNKATR